MIKLTIFPRELEVDGAKAKIYEIVDVTPPGSKEKQYLVTCAIEYGDYRSKVFSIIARSEKELKTKLRVEVAKMKVLLLLGETRFFESRS